MTPSSVHPSVHTDEYENHHQNQAGQEIVTFCLIKQINLHTLIEHFEGQHKTNALMRSINKTHSTGQATVK